MGQDHNISISNNVLSNGIFISVVAAIYPVLLVQPPPLFLCLLLLFRMRPISILEHSWWDWSAGSSAMNNFDSIAYEFSSTPQVNSLIISMFCMLISILAIVMLTAAMLWFLSTVPASSYINLFHRIIASISQLLLSGSWAQGNPPTNNFHRFWGSNLLSISYRF